MKASFKSLALGFLLLVPFATAHAQAPSLSPIANVSLNAGGTVTVNLVAVDVGGRLITLTSSLPPFATLNSPTSGTGTVVTTMTLTPSSANVGTYTAAVTATAGGAPSIKTFQITVNAEGSDRAPVVSAPALQEVTEGLTLGFTVSASDPDGDAITSLDVSGLPFGAAFTPNVSNTSGMFSWATGAGDAGEYDLVFTASNSLSGGAATHIHVASAPTLALHPIADVTMAEGASVSVPVSASGVPGALVTLTASLPSFGALNPPGSGTGAVSTTITLTPPAGSAGTHHASVTATSLGVFVTQTFDVIVTGGTGGGNHPPVLSAPATQTVAVGSTLNFDVTATDADGDHVTLTGSALPPGSAFNDNGDNTGTFLWSPVSGQAGTYTASFSGNDGRGGSGSASTEITVTGGVVENHAPTLSAPTAQSVTEGATLTFEVTGSDQDGDHVALFGSGLPPGSTFNDNGDDTGTFLWTPGSGQIGTHTASFSGTDGRGGSGSASTEITVTGAPENHAPTLSAPTAVSVDEGQNLTFAVTATDQDGDHVALSANSPPSGSTFVDHGDNTGAFSWTPGSTQSGVYTVTFAGNDGHGGTASATTTITVNDVGGGTAEVPGKACLIGSFQSRNGATCFRLRPVNGSFDLRDVVLSSITFVFNGASVAALNDGTRIELQCHGKGGGDDQGAIHLSGDNHGGDDDGEGHDCGGLVCGEHGGNDEHPGNGGGKCDTLGIRACFSTQALLDVLAGAKMPCDLVHAEIRATLTNGGTVVATFGDHKQDGDDDKDKDKDKGGHGEKDARLLNPKARPNPLNPMTELSFTMSREGRVRVTVYDMQGRLVNTLLDEVRGVGVQKVAWDGSNAQNGKVASGVYFFQIQAPEGRVVQRVAVVK
jgi:hypothetical protein